MTWTPANTWVNCLKNPTNCSPSILNFVVLILQSFGVSYDEYFNGRDEGAEAYDFIIVGGGSAGCVLANSLSEIEEWKVLLLEAGDEEPSVTDVPAFHPFLFGSSVDWQYKTEPQSNACLSFEEKRCSYSSGKVMGGTSTINSMYYSRGNKYDYDNWEKLGNPGWSYDEVLPYFKKSEDMRDKNVLSDDPENHSAGGYLTVDRLPYVDRNMQTLIDAYRELGYKDIDLTLSDKIGFNRGMFTVINGARQSSNGAFLRPIRGKRLNLVIRSNSPVTKIIIDQETKKAVGVEYSSADDKRISTKIFVRKEVIISAGVFNSPKLLMLSGIGKTDELRRLGIKTIIDLPVGENFHDHVNVFPFTVIFNKNSTTLISIDNVENDIAYWMSTHEGPLSTLGAPGDLTGYMQTSRENISELPDILVVMQSKIVEEGEQTSCHSCKKFHPSSYYNAMEMKLKLLSPKSKGRITLNEVDPTWGPPLIQPNYFSNSEDLRTVVEGSKMLKKFLTTQAFKKSGITVVNETRDACKHLEFQSSKYFKCIAVNYTQAGLHGVGSCKMGPAHDSTAVVDHKLRVHGIMNLRIIDASIMPIVPRGHTNAPTIMIAEKGGDMIKEDWLR